MTDLSIYDHAPADLYAGVYEPPADREEALAARAFELMQQFYLNHQIDCFASCPVDTVQAAIKFALASTGSEHGQG